MERFLFNNHYPTWMRICLISPRYINEDMRGSEEFVKTLSNKLSDRYLVNVISSDSLDPVSSLSLSDRKRKTGIEEVKKNLEVVRLESVPSFSFPLHIISGLISLFNNKYQNIYLFRIADLIRVYGWGPYLKGLKNEILDGNFDVIHASTFPTTSAFQAFRIAKKYKIPFTFTPFFHYHLSSFKSSYILKYMLNNADAIIACTNLEAKEIEKLGVNPDKISVIPLAFDPEPVKHLLVKQDEALKHLGLTNKFVILSHPWVGKGIISILKSLADLSDERDVALLTIGKPDQLYLEEKRKLAKLHPKLVTLDLGWVTGRAKWMAFSACDIFALPSYTDAFGLSYLNAWAAGKPIIVAKGSAMEDMVSPFRDGYIIDPMKVSEVKELLEYLFDSPEELKCCGKRGKEKLKDEFNSYLVSQKYENLFTQLTSKR